MAKATQGDFETTAAEYTFKAPTRGIDGRGAYVSRSIKLEGESLEVRHSPTGVPITAIESDAEGKPIRYWRLSYSRHPQMMVVDHDVWAWGWQVNALHS